MNRSFTVETRESCVGIFGGPSELVSKLIKQIHSLNFFAAKITNTNEIEEIKTTYDLDYLVVFGDEVSVELIPTLQTLIGSGESRLIRVTNATNKKQDFVLNPVAKKISISDYIGDAELDSPLIESWIKNINSNHKISVQNDGLDGMSLLGINDLSNLLAKAILSPYKGEGEEIILGNPDSISLLNLAYLIRTNLPFKITLVFNTPNQVTLGTFDPTIFESTLTKLDYQLVDDPQALLIKYLKSNITNHLGGNPITIPQIQSSKKIEKVSETKQIQETIEAPHKKLTPLKMKQPTFVPLQTRKIKLSLSFKRPSFHKHLGPPSFRSIIGRGIVIAIALYLGTLAFSATIASLTLKNIFSTIHSGAMPASNKLNTFSLTYLQANWVIFTSFPGLHKSQTVNEINLLLDGYSQALSIFSTSQSLDKSSGELISYVFGNGNTDVAQVVSLSRLQAEELYQKLSLLDGSLPSDPPPIIPPKYQGLYLEGKNKLVALKRSTTSTKALLATLPDLIGLGNRRKYAILFQNNMELRPTGGFIGSFAIITLENGRLYDMPIFDVYEVDGELKGHVEPPKPIKEILGEANWYLRDSNFDPDFPTSARRAEWFIKKTMNIDLDGTIALNINSLAALLSTTGPLNVEGYNETITSSNLAERTQFHAEGNFFPGSTQKKEFLSTVASAIFTRIGELSEGEGLKLITGLGETIKEKNTLISATTPSADRIFATLGWNGSLSDFPCPTTSACHKDYAMIVDSNFGINKANYFLKRNIEEVITFDKNLSVGHTLRANYQNTSPSTAWPAGIYKNYQRLYLPIGTTVNKIKINGKELQTSDYSVSQEHGKFIIAYLVSVPVGGETLVEIEYATPQLPQDKELLYTWYWQKQSGTSSDDQLTVYINYPAYLNPVVISPQSDLLNQQLKFDLKNDVDHRVTVKFSK